MTRVLIAGGAGYIGSHAVYGFLDAGHEVAVVDDLSTGQAGALPPTIPVTRADIGDAAAMDRLLAAFRPTALLHFAGSTIVPESLVAPARYYRNNTLNSLTLFEACIRHGVEQIVFSSSAAVYAVDGDAPATEETPTRPATPYGWSKLMTEQILGDLAAAHGLGFAALRYFNVAGADAAGRTGQSTPNATHLIKVACEVAAGKRARLDVFGVDHPTPDGTCIRDYIHVSDLIDAHLLAFGRIAKTGERLVLNCGVGRGASVREVIAAVERETGRPLPVRETDPRPGDLPRVVADPARIRDVLGWRPRHADLGAIVASALAWESRSV